MKNENTESIQPEKKSIHTLMKELLALTQDKFTTKLEELSKEDLGGYDLSELLNISEKDAKEIISTLVKSIEDELDGTAREKVAVSEQKQQTRERVGNAGGTYITFPIG